MHENLIASFDFAINKPKQAVEKEQQSVIDNHIPFYQLSNELSKDQIRVLEANVQSGFPSSKFDISLDEYLQELLPVFQKVYWKGVINIDSKHQGYDEDSKINLLVSNVLAEKTVGDFYTAKQAFQLIDSITSLNSYLNNSFTRSLYKNSLIPNIYFDKEKTENHLSFLLDNISLTRGMVQKGELVVAKGDLIDDNVFQVLTSLKTEFEQKVGGKDLQIKIIVGQLILISVLFTILMLFLAIFRKDIFNDNNKIGLILLLITSMLLLVSWGIRANFLSLYVLPYCMVPIILRVLFDTRLALFVYIIIILLAGFFVPNGFEFVFIEIVAGMVAIFSIINMRKRAQFFISAALILVTYTIVFIGIKILQGSMFGETEWVNLAWLVVSAFLSLLAYPMIYAFEKLFGFISEITLLELADTNNPLLKELSIHAPGTFQHTLQVSNLAEAAVYDIGGNAPLVRAGALYHDIGKMDMSQFFIENQNTGINPHDEISPDESASIIIDHVIKGIEKAQKHNLPDEIIDFIRTHHGTTRVEYFYHLHTENSLLEEDLEKKFRYPGPLPYSKETAILMMADSVEASARSIKEPTKQKLDELVDHIIDTQIFNNQFINSDITFSDIKNTKNIFKKMLQSIYHVRVEYPKN
ncbi:MAG: transmembrane HD family protein [Bacteroidetes bacterium]|nr:MAG: transmembrane HD family protein [Bacteroidota bacterium]